MSDCTPDGATVKATWTEFFYLQSHGMKHVDDSGTEFDRFIAKVKADALREAATEFAARLPDGTGNGRAYNSYRVAELLNARADRIGEDQ